MASLELRLLDEAVVHSAIDLIQRQYGYTSLYDWVYDPERILAVAHADDNRFFVGVDAKGVVRATVAIRFCYPEKTVAELGLLFIDSMLSQTVGGLFLKQLAPEIRAFSTEMYKKVGLRALVSSVVTVHPVSQRLNHQIGFTPTGIYLGLIPTWADRDLPGQINRYTGLRGYSPTMDDYRLRRAEILYCRPIYRAVIPPHLVSLPEPFAPLLRDIYARMELKFIEQPCYPAQGQTILEERLHTHSSRVVLEVRQVGDDVIQRVLERVDHFCKGLIDLVHIVLPLSGADIAPCIQALLARGACYAALLPSYRQSDCIALQLLNGVEENLRESQIFDPFAQRILRVVRGQTEAIASTNNADSTE
jgi:hypothetical protein